MNILIIDDDRNFINILKRDINLYLRDNDEQIFFELKSDDFFNIQSLSLDFAFIDIDLVTENGIEVAKELNKKFPLAKIIFISVREDLVFQTFSATVFQFIRKSNYDYDKKVVFGQINEYVSNNLNRKVIKTVSGRKVNIRPDKIKYILSMGHELSIFEDKEYIVKGSVSSLLDDLDCSLLVQIQRAFVVNFNFIKQIKNNKLITKNDKCYTIGRKYQEELISRYEEYLLR